MNFCTDISPQDVADDGEHDCVQTSSDDQIHAQWDGNCIPVATLMIFWQLKKNSMPHRPKWGPYRAQV